MRSLVHRKIALCIFLAATISIVLSLPQRDIDVLQKIRANTTPDPWASVVGNNFCGAVGVGCIDEGLPTEQLITLFLKNVRVTLGDWMSNLTTLTDLQYYTCSFENTPIMPASMGSMVNLTHYSFQDCRNVPKFATVFPYVQQFEIGLSDTEELPKYANLPSLQLLQISYVNFTKTPVVLPAEYAQYTTLNNMRIVHCNIEGTIPAEYGNIGSAPDINIRWLAISHTQVSGTIPNTLNSFYLLDLSNNQLTGTIPKEFGGVDSKISQIALNNNQLVGEVPINLWTTPLDRIELQSNYLTGCLTVNTTIPQCDISENYLCCVPSGVKCNVTGINCFNGTCATPPPVTNATCELGPGGVPVWNYKGPLVVNNEVTLTEVTVFGDLIISADVTINDGDVITVYGCANINGSLTLNLSPEEINQLEVSGTLDRPLIIYDSACQDANINFDKIEVNAGDFGCATVQSKQQNKPGLISILITKDLSMCLGPTSSLYTNDDSKSSNVPDWAIAVIVVGAALVVAAVVVPIVLVKRHEQLEQRLSTATARAAN